ncbi:hypothetical protein Tco_0533014 [Tanacetum coccineum]
MSTSNHHYPLFTSHKSQPLVTVPAVNNGGRIYTLPFDLNNSMDKSCYTKWDKHGEKDEQATTAQIPVNATTEFLDDTDFDMDFGSEIPTDGPATVEMVNATKESFDEDDLAKFQELL